MPRAWSTLPRLVRLLPLVAALLIAGLCYSVVTVRGQSLGIHVASATNTQPILFSRGCNVVVTDSPSGVKVAGIVSLISPQDAVIGIWRYNNGAQNYNAGFFADQSAPTDFSLTGAGPGGRVTEAYWVCVSKGASMLSG